MMPNFDIGQPRAACPADNKTIISISMTLESRGKLAEKTIRKICTNCHHLNQGFN